MKFRRLGVSIFSSVSRGSLILILLLISLWFWLCVHLEAGESYELDRKWRVLSLSLEGKFLPKGLSVGFKVGDTIDITQLRQGCDKLREILYTNGFFWAEVEVETTIDSLGMVVKYIVKPNQKAKIGGWKLIGNDGLLESQLLSVLPKKGNGFNYVLLTEGVNRLLSKYADFSFPFAEVRFIGLRESGGQVFPSFNIYEGPKVKIGFITFSGTKEESERYRLLLTRQSGFRGAVYYTPRQVKLWRENLEKGGWISVDSHEIVTRDSQYGVRFWISETQSGEVFGVVGYAPESRMLFGVVKVEVFNLFSSGRRLKGEWYSASEEVGYHLEYTEPWILGTPLSLSVAIKHNVFDTIFSQTRFSLIGKLVRNGGGVVIGTGFDRTLSQNPKQRLWIRAGFVFDTYDQVLNPRKGINLRVETATGTQSGQNGGSGMVGWVEVDGAWVVSLTKKLTLMNNLSLRGIFSDVFLDQLDLFRVGGMENVRGYRENGFSADQLGWWNCELRYHFAQNSRLHIFIDNCIFSQYGIKDRNWISAYGVGGRFLSRLGIVGIDYAVPLKESPSRGKIHLSLQTKF